MANSRSRMQLNVTTVAAAGSNSQANSTLVPKVPVVVVTTVSSTARGIRLPADLPVGAGIQIFNGTGTEVNVYPGVGGWINSLAANAVRAQGANTGCEYRQVSAGRWRVMVGA